MAEDRRIFYLGDKLPTVYDAAIAIFSICRNPNSEKMHNTLLLYARNLILMWTRLVGEKHTITRSAVVRKLELIVKTYYNQV